MATTEEATQIMEQSATVRAAVPAQASPISAAKADKIRFVREHAKAYCDAGWDVVIEAVTDERLAEVIGRARSMTGAVNAVRHEIVEPWVIRNIEARPGEDDDPQLAMGRAFEAERLDNWYDATARLEGRTNTIVPPRAEARSVMPMVVEVDLTHFEAPGGLQPAKNTVTADEPDAEPEAGEPSEETTDGEEAEAQTPQVTEKTEGEAAAEVIEAVAQGEAVKAAAARKPRAPRKASPAA